MEFGNQKMLATAGWAGLAARYLHDCTEAKIPGWLLAAQAWLQIAGLAEQARQGWLG